MNRDEVELAIESADKMLTQYNNLSYISHSSYLMRVYYLGLYAGLSAVTDESNLEYLLMHALHSTMFARSGDDLFKSTQIGRLYENIKTQLQQSARNLSRRCDDKQPNSSTDEQFKKLDDLIQEQNHFWHQHFEGSIDILVSLRHTVGGLGSTNTHETECAYNQIMKMMEELERLLRTLSFHKDGKRCYLIEDD